ENGAQAPRNRRLFHHATPPQIREGMARLSADWQVQLSHRRICDLGSFVRYLLRYPEEHRGTFLGLVREAIRWHRTHFDYDDVDFDGNELPAGYDESTPTSLPKFPLPEMAGVHFLSTVGAIRSESKRMQHCVNSYVDKAVSGECFLFHVEYRCDCATVELAPSGEVRQARGPNNQPNKATAYAEQVLGEWAKRLTRQKSVSVSPTSA
ncbi:MAG: PcfJ domain-containing protein, partial [bacterium]|nr:PcfJ domain-containing protein [bacterium]